MDLFGLKVPREAAPRSTAAPTVAKGDYPYGIPFLASLISWKVLRRQIRGRAGSSGTEVKDPYTDKIFLVP
jgi:hypothetical protein